MKQKSIYYILLYLGVILASQVHATIALDTYVFGSFSPTTNNGANLHFIAPTSNTLFVATNSTGNSIVLNPILLPLTAGQLIGQIYNYPNPFSLRSGTEIGYQLTGPMTIELRIYTITGYQVYQKTFMPTEEGGFGRYNKVPINLSTLNGEWLAPGVYIYALFSEGKLIARNRMVIKP